MHLGCLRSTDTELTLLRLGLIVAASRFRSTPKPAGVSRCFARTAQLLVYTGFVRGDSPGDSEARTIQILWGSMPPGGGKSSTLPFPSRQGNATPVMDGLEQKCALCGGFAFVMPHTISRSAVSFFELLHLVSSHPAPDFVLPSRHFWPGQNTTRGGAVRGSASRNSEDNSKLYSSGRRPQLMLSRAIAKAGKGREGFRCMIDKLITLMMQASFCAPVTLDFLRVGLLPSSWHSEVMRGQSTAPRKEKACIHRFATCEAASEASPKWSILELPFLDAELARHSQST